MKNWFKAKPVIIAVSGVLLAGAILFLSIGREKNSIFRWTALAADSTQEIARNLVVHKPIPVAQATTVVAQREHAKELKAAQIIVSNLLFRPSGQVTISQAREWVRQLKDNGESAKPVLWNLLDSTNETARLLGTYLILETEGPSDEILSRVRGDSSWFVIAQASAWLYENDHFDEWRRFHESCVADLTAPRASDFLALFDRIPARLAVSGALEALRLGEGLPTFLQGLGLNSAEFLGVIEQQLIDPIKPMERRIAILQSLHEIAPANQIELLEQIIANESESVRLRREALSQYCQSTFNTNSATFVRRISQVSSSPPWTRSLLDAEAILQQRMAIGGFSLQNTERTVRESIASSQGIRATLPAVIEYVEVVRRTSAAKIDSPTLESVRAFVRKQIDQGAFPLKQQALSLDYIAWKEKRE